MPCPRAVVLLAVPVGTIKAQGLVSTGFCRSRGVLNGDDCGSLFWGERTGFQVRMIGFARCILLAASKMPQWQLIANLNSNYFSFTRIEVKQKLQNNLASYERRGKRRLSQFENEQPGMHEMTSTKVKKSGVKQALPQVDTFQNLPTLYSEELLTLNFDHETENEMTCSLSCQSAMIAATWKRTESAWGWRMRNIWNKITFLALPQFPDLRLE